MSLQSYRSQLAAKHNRRLMVYFVLAVGIHAGGLWLGHSQQWLSKKPLAPTPIEFVNVESSSAEQPPESTKRQAQTNSAATRNPNSERPPQTGRTGTKALRSIGSPDTPTLATRPSSVPIPPLPPSVASPVPLSTPVPFTPVPSATPLPTPFQQAGSTTVEPSRSSPSPLRPASPQPVASPRTTVTNPSPSLEQTLSSQSQSSSSSSPSSTAQLGDPLTASAVLEGLNGQLNPNRFDNGSSVDAVQDDLWGTYLSALNQTVDRNWQRISVEATRRTRVRFRVDRQGNLTELRVLESSGDTRADQAAIQAIQAAAPFAPLPRNASEEVLIVNFTFTQWR
jgi:protein TonB